MIKFLGLAAIYIVVLILVVSVSVFIGAFTTPVHETKKGLARSCLVSSLIAAGAILLLLVTNGYLAWL